MHWCAFATCNDAPASAVLFVKQNNMVVVLLSCHLNAPDDGGYFTSFFFNAFTVFLIIILLFIQFSVNFYFGRNLAYQNEYKTPEWDVNISLGEIKMDMNVTGCVSSKFVGVSNAILVL